MLAASVKPCMEIVVDLMLEHAFRPSAIDFHTVVISPNAGAISTSSEFLFILSFRDSKSYSLVNIFNPFINLFRLATKSRYVLCLQLLHALCN